MLDPENKGTTIFDKSGWIFNHAVLTALNLAVLHPSYVLNEQFEFNRVHFIKHGSVETVIVVHLV